MLSDIYDVDELMTSKRREGIYSGITPSSASFSGIAFYRWGWGCWPGSTRMNTISAGAWEPHSTQYATTGVALTIKWMFVVIPVVFLAAALIFALRYKLDCKRFNSVIQGIEKLKSGLNPVDFSSDEKATYELLTGKAAESLWDSRIAG